MIVVADTTPLISLMKVGHLNLVQQLFGEIQIPNAVYQELVYNTRFPEESRQIRECPFIKIESICYKDGISRRGGYVYEGCE